MDVARYDKRQLQKKSVLRQLYKDMRGGEQSVDTALAQKTKYNDKALTALKNDYLKFKDNLIKKKTELCKFWRAIFPIFRQIWFRYLPQ